MTVPVVGTIDEIRSRLDSERRAGHTIGFVPTMGYLHDGHGSLMRAARADNDVVVASIFVNPLQFAPDEDLDDYPRDLDRDRALAGTNGVDVLFVPSVDEMYPDGSVLASVSVTGLSRRWEGESRPTHFNGVATVVAKLFNIIGPCRAYFGRKDFQQLVVIRRMVRDLSFPVDVVGCPIMREPDGLAMSSRNIYLSPGERSAAVVLRRALDAGTTAIEAGERVPTKVTDLMAGMVEAEPLARLDYVAAVDPSSLETPDILGPRTQLLITAYVGSTRLIDNCAVTIADQDTTRVASLEL